MTDLNDAVSLLQTIVISIGAGLGICGVTNLLDGYCKANVGIKSEGMRQLIVGVIIATIGIALVPLLVMFFGMEGMI